MRTYTYDANGNTLTAGDKTYTYNDRGQQTGYSNGTTTASYAYNPSGLRKAKTVGGSTKYFVYNGMNIVYEYSESVADSVAYFYGLNRTHNSNGEIYVYNAHGDVVQLVCDNSVVASYTYDAFGNLTSQLGESDNPFLYCGEYYDAETQTYYLRARYYNPANGRFTQQDAWAFMDASDPLSLNLYAYCCNNPVMYVDPSGHDAIIIVNENFTYDFWGIKIPLGHMGALVQNENGEWDYFSYSNTYVKMDKVAKYGTKDFSLADLSDAVKYSGGNAEYTASVYIAGDFTETFAYFKDLANQGTSYVDEYNPITNNCSKVVLRGIEKGVLGDGTSVKDYIQEKCLLENRSYRTTIPLLALKDLKELFYNEAYSYDEYHKAINDQLWESQYGVWYHRNPIAAHYLSKLNY